MEDPGVVDVQPQNTIHPDQSKILEKITLAAVKTWSAQEVVNEFLAPLNLGHLGPMFKANSITGTLLLTLSKDDLRAMKILHVGDRLYIMSTLAIVKRENKMARRNKTLFSIDTPDGGMAYYGDVATCLKYKLCPCMMETIKYTITEQGIWERTIPPFCSPCTGQTNNFEDFRFYKEKKYEYKRCCCMRYHELTIIFRHTDGGKGQHVQMVIDHPRANNSDLGKVVDSRVHATNIAAN